MVKFPVNIDNTSNCIKCNYKYSSSITVFSIKDHAYETSCPKCGTANQNKLAKKKIEEQLDKDTQSPIVQDERNTYLKTRAGVFGLYICSFSILLYLVASIFQGSDNDSIRRIIDVIEFLFLPGFFTGVTLVLYKLLRNGKLMPS